tara:strand:+ start:41100 stop:41264 length:165 start_codon:yes stop_codon:yes gene_type:complete
MLNFYVISDIIRPTTLRTGRTKHNIAVMDIAKTGKVLTFNPWFSSSALGVKLFF